MSLPPRASIAPEKVLTITDYMCHDSNSRALLFALYSDGGDYFALESNNGTTILPPLQADIEEVEEALLYHLKQAFRVKNVDRYRRTNTDTPFKHVRETI